MNSDEPPETSHRSIIDNLIIFGASGSASGLKRSDPFEKECFSTIFNLLIEEPYLEQFPQKPEADVGFAKPKLYRLLQDRGLLIQNKTVESEDDDWTVDILYKQMNILRYVLSRQSSASELYRWIQFLKQCVAVPTLEFTERELPLFTDFWKDVGLDQIKRLRAAGIPIALKDDECRWALRLLGRVNHYENLSLATGRNYATHELRRRVSVKNESVETHGRWDFSWGTALWHEIANNRITLEEALDTTRRLHEVLHEREATTTMLDRRHIGPMGRYEFRISAAIDAGYPTEWKERGKDAVLAELRDKQSQRFKETLLLTGTIFAVVGAGGQIVIPTALLTAPAVIAGVPIGAYLFDSYLINAVSKNDQPRKLPKKLLRRFWHSLQLPKDGMTDD